MFTHIYFYMQYVVYSPGLFITPPIFTIFTSFYHFYLIPINFYFITMFTDFCSFLFNTYFNTFELRKQNWLSRECNLAGRCRTDYQRRMSYIERGSQRSIGASPWGLSRGLLRAHMWSQGKNHLKGLAGKVPGIHAGLFPLGRQENFIIYREFDRIKYSEKPTLKLLIISLNIKMTLVVFKNHKRKTFIKRFPSNWTEIPNKAQEYLWEYKTIPYLSR